MGRIKAQVKIIHYYEVEFEVDLEKSIGDQAVDLAWEAHQNPGQSIEGVKDHCVEVENIGSGPADEQEGS